jgi:hypothetical protein
MVDAIASVRVGPTADSCSAASVIVRRHGALKETMLINLEVNAHTSRIGSVAELRQELAPFASQQFREIWVSVGPGGPSLAALINTNVGWLTYWRGHDDRDPGFSSRNPMYDESDTTLGGLAYDSLYDGRAHAGHRLSAQQWAGGRISGKLGVARARRHAGPGILCRA